MPALKTKDGDIAVSAERIARMADRMFRIRGDGRRQNYAERARKRIAAGPARKDDVALVIATGG